MIWRCRDRVFELDSRVLVLGVVNLTPDSFSDGGRFLDPGEAAAEAERQLEAGADVIDLGAESTRPGSAPVPADEQWRRLQPALDRIAAGPACVSIDTSSASVAQRALEHGARIVNDVTALGDPAMAGVAARSGAGVILMHLRGTPLDMQDDPRYDDAAREIRDHLAERLAVARAAGIDESAVALDPGLGFGKSAAHNFELLARLDEIAALGRPVVVGASRKSFLGRALDLPVDQRLEGGLAAAAIAVFEGARIVRTHDVAATVRAVAIAERLRAARRLC